MVPLAVDDVVLLAVDDVVLLAVDDVAHSLPALKHNTNNDVKIILHDDDKYAVILYN